MVNGIWSKKQVARFIGISLPTVDRWEKAGKFPKRTVLSFYQTGRPARVGWPMDVVMAWYEDLIRPGAPIPSSEDAEDE
jgi:predicted DNA-binding transcriptional regulator AlpA